MFQAILRFEVNTRSKRWRMAFGKAVRRALPWFRLQPILAFLFGRSVEIAVMGKKLNMDLRDGAVSSAIFAQGVWESDETLFVSKILRQGMVFVDVGAHIGYYTVISSDIVGNCGKVFAFEPDARNFSFLRENIIANHCQNVIAEQKAVAASSHKLFLYRSSNNFGDHRVYDPESEGSQRHGNGRSCIAVEAVSLDEYFRDMPVPIDLVKMDIQGAEYNAYLGMRALLQQHCNIVILTEFWPKGLRQAGACPDAFLSEVRRCGFGVYQLYRGEPRETSDPDILQRLTGDAYMSLIFSRHNVCSRIAEKE
jgi:FkbM family methyltransferase